MERSQSLELKKSIYFIKKNMQIIPAVDDIRVHHNSAESHLLFSPRH